jgi:hypothetical protein
MRILALDLGKYKSVACDYEAETGGHRFTTIPTNLHSVVDVFVDSHTRVDVTIDGAPVIRNRSFERSDISAQVVDQL